MMTQQKSCLTHCEPCNEGCDSLRIHPSVPKLKSQSYSGMQSVNAWEEKYEPLMTDVFVLWAEDGKRQ